MAARFTGRLGALPGRAVAVLPVTRRFTFGGTAMFRNKCGSFELRIIAALPAKSSPFTAKWSQVRRAVFLRRGGKGKSP